MKENKEIRKIKSILYRGWIEHFLFFFWPFFLSKEAKRVYAETNENEYKMCEWEKKN